MVWSPSSSLVICFSCSVFGNGNCGSSDKSLFLCWNRGIKDGWRKLNDRIEVHHSNPVHLNYYLSWKTAQLNLTEHSGVDSAIQKALGAEESKWREIYRCILDATLFLFSRNLAFRGKYFFSSNLNCCYYSIVFVFV